jgi:hypothetical protein
VEDDAVLETAEKESVDVIRRDAMDVLEFLIALIQGLNVMTMMQKMILE